MSVIGPFGFQASLVHAGDAERCPACGSSAGPIQVVWGYPTPETEEAAERSEVLLGGCLPEGHNAECRGCGAPWGQSGGPTGYTWRSPRHPSR